MFPLVLTLFLATTESPGEGPPKCPEGPQEVWATPAEGEPVAEVCVSDSITGITLEAPLEVWDTRKGPTWVTVTSGPAGLMIRRKAEVQEGERGTIELRFRQGVESQYAKLVLVSTGDARVREVRLRPGNRTLESYRVENEELRRLNRELQAQARAGESPRASGHILGQAFIDGLVRIMKSTVEWTRCSAQASPPGLLSIEDCAVLIGPGTTGQREFGVILAIRNDSSVPWVAEQVSVTNKGTELVGAVVRQKTPLGPNTRDMAFIGLPQVPAMASGGLSITLRSGAVETTVDVRLAEAGTK